MNIDTDTGFTMNDSDIRLIVNGVDCGKAFPAGTTPFFCSRELMIVKVPARLKPEGIKNIREQTMALFEKIGLPHCEILFVTDDIEIVCLPRSLKS